MTRGKAARAAHASPFWRGRAAYRGVALTPLGEAALRIIARDAVPCGGRTRLNLAITPGGRAAIREYELRRGDAAEGGDDTPAAGVSSQPAGVSDGAGSFPEGDQ